MEGDIEKVIYDAYTATQYGFKLEKVTMNFEHVGRTFFVYQNKQGDYCVCDHITGYALHVDPKLEKCITRGKKKIDKALEKNFDWKVYPEVNTLENIFAFEIMQKLIPKIQKASQINLHNKIKIKF